MHIFGGTIEELREYKLNGPYKGLAQPLEGKIGYSDELLGTIIDSTYWETPKEEIIQVYDLKTGKIKAEYTGKVEYILEYLDKKYLSTIIGGPIGDIVKGDAEYFLQKIIKTK